jgi:hypothetical protein
MSRSNRSNSYLTCGGLIMYGYLNSRASVQGDLYPVQMQVVQIASRPYNFRSV